MAPWGNSAVRIAAAVTGREVLPHAVTAQFLDRAARLEREVLAWVRVDGPGALEQAKACDASPDGPLAGVPVGIKDVIDVRGFATRAGSKARDTMPAAEKDSLVVTRLRRAGSVIMGKTVTTEFATMDPAPTRNPYRLTHTPGGSSSGSAAAVAAGMVPLALGTQTAGSLCRPAAYCGVAAYKPSFGLVPTGGMTPLAPSFDTIGVIGRRVADVRLAGAAMSGIPLNGAAREAGPVACLRAADYPGSVPDVRELYAKAIATLRQDGQAVVEIDLAVDFAEIVRDHRTVMASEAFAAHGHLLSLPAGVLGRQFAGLLGEGRALPDRATRLARERLAMARDTVWRKLRDVAAILLQPVPAPAPAGLEATGPIHYLVPWTVFGGPLVVVPGSLSTQGVPLAVMVGAAPGHDAVALTVAERLASRIDALPDAAGDPPVARRLGAAG